MSDYRYTRAAARGLLFCWLERSMPAPAKRRFAQAWKQITPAERAVLRRHQTGSVRDWPEEEAGVDSLRRELLVVDEARLERRRRLAA